MTECSLCRMIDDKSLTIFENDNSVVMLHPEPSVPGHVIIVPKEHAEIIENIPDDTIKEMLVSSTKLSVVLFEALQAQGSNVMWLNGTSAGQRRNHAALHVLPRKENDGLSLAWKPKQLSEEEMSMAELRLKEAAGTVGIPEEGKKPEPREIKKPEAEEEVSARVKHLERVP